MEQLREYLGELLDPELTGVIGGLLIGMGLGAVIQRTDFCTMGAVADFALFGDTKRLRAWFLAIAVALAGTQLLILAGIIDLSETIYLSGNVFWLGAIAGGLMFGIGMMLAGGCGSKNLARVGSGDLRALVVIVIMGLFAEFALRGLFALPRIWLMEHSAFELTSGAAPSQQIAGIAGLAGTAQIIAAFCMAIAVGAVCLFHTGFRKSGATLLSGILVGALVVAGWLVTGFLAADPFSPAPPISLTFVAPVGDSFLYLMTFTGSSIRFGIAVVFGVVLGAWIAAVYSKEFRLQSFSGVGETVRSLAGAALMGCGGVLATGCTIGQGITGISTFAAGSLLALIAIICGGFIGIRLLERYAA